MTLEAEALSTSLEGQLRFASPNSEKSELDGRAVCRLRDESREPMRRAKVGSGARPAGTRDGAPWLLTGRGAGVAAILGKRAWKRHLFFCNF